MAKGNPDIVKTIVKDIEDSVKEAEKQVNPLTLTIPDIKMKKTPLVFIGRDGKAVIRGDRNPNLAFVKED